MKIQILFKIIKTHMNIITGQLKETIYIESAQNFRYNYLDNKDNGECVYYIYPDNTDRGYFICNNIQNSNSAILVAQQYYSGSITENEMNETFDEVMDRMESTTDADLLNIGS